jgi:hypothetical protein
VYCKYLIGWTKQMGVAKRVHIEDLACKVVAYLLLMLQVGQESGG